VLNGQSLWDQPPNSDSVAAKILLGRDVTTYRAYRGGFAWSQYATNPLLLAEVTRNANSAPLSILVMMGGTTDITLGTSGSATYDNMVTISAAFKAATGLTDFATRRVIAATTTPSTSFSGDDNTQLGILNGLVVANGDAAFDAVVDLAANPDLDDPTNTTYYADGTHPTAVGATLIADLLGVAVDALIAA
jgi:lysophospholipase L1-like esterase